MTTAPVRALLFDLGGVLLEIDSRRVFAYWSTHSGVAASVLQQRFVIDAAYFALERGEIDTHSYFKHLAATLRIDLPEDIWLAGWNSVLGDVNSEAMTLLASLHEQRPLYLFSNTNAAHHASWAKTCALLLANFSGCFVSHELGQRKPDKTAFDLVVARIGVPAGQILLFDDLEENVSGAHRAGLQAAHVPDRAALRKCLADARAALC